jgi:uncharacterized protein
MDLLLLAEKYSIYKFNNDCVLPGWIYLSDFYSITKTRDEISVVALQTDLMSEVIACDQNWRVLKIAEPLDLSLIGVIAEISKILKEKNISIFAISTYDTDYILVKQKDLKGGLKALRDKKYKIHKEK